MADTTEGARKGLIRDFAARLKFPQLFFVVAAIFLIDLLVPDLLPFADEILLGLVTALLGTLRKEPVETGEEKRPPIKNVTPPDG